MSGCPDACQYICCELISIFGIHNEVLEDLVTRPGDRDGKYVVLTMDEMKVKEDLVYNKHTCPIIGYVNLGSTEQQLIALEKEGKSTASLVATHVLQFMVRGICMKLDYPVAHFATTNLTAEQLYPMVWQVVKIAGLKVMIIIADGATQTGDYSTFMDTLLEANVFQGVTYKAINFYAPERNVYFISDVPHLMKTSRNCWEKSRLGGTRLMQVYSYYVQYSLTKVHIRSPMQKGGQYILWKHLKDLYMKTHKESGLYIGKKITIEQIFPTSYSRMRVDLAAQVYYTYMIAVYSTLYLV